MRINLSRYIIVEKSFSHVFPFITCDKVNTVAHKVNHALDIVSSEGSGWTKILLRLNISLKYKITSKAYQGTDNKGITWVWKEDEIKINIKKIFIEYERVWKIINNASE